jgi:Uma2 family endonuclease
MPATAARTADELLHLDIPGKSLELVRGVLVVNEPPGFLHGAVAARLANLMTNYVNEHHLGLVLAAETGFKLESNPDTVRACDVAFLSREHVPDPLPTGYATLAPDLVVEVLSPRDRPGAVLAKVGDWLDAGAQLVWVVDPVARRGRVYRADGSEVQLAEGDALEGETVLPGFTCRLGSVL